MYRVTDELDFNGFSINSIETIVNRNKGNLKFDSTEYFLIYIAYNRSCIIVEEREFVVEANHMAYIAPFKSVVYDQNFLDNNIIAFSSYFYEKSAKDSFILNSPLFFNNDLDVFIAPSIGTAHEIKKMVVNRLDLYSNREKGLYMAVAHNCVEILLLDGLLTIAPMSNSEKLEKIDFSYIDIVNKFRILLQKHIKKEKGVLFYSNKLCVSPQRLSIITELVVGKGAKKIIIDKINSEAVRMLKFSKFNISEIAIELGFENEGNFSGFIKRHQGRTPSEIRNNFGKDVKITNL